jgi:DNA polymerase
MPSRARATDTAVAEREPAPVPAQPTEESMREAVQRCRACDLWTGATQGVMGEGADHARLMLVGEQPGDREDIEGHPFVGPAGRVLDEGLEQAGIARHDVYITNVVKHFRYKARGKRRIHQKPDRWQVNACLPWLEAELSMVRPEALVCLGATAAQALLGSHVRIGRDRGRPIESDLAELVTITTHPSSILRITEREDRLAAMEEFVRDLTTVAQALRSGHPPAGEPALGGNPRP